jgi:hypothetical protein
MGYVAPGGATTKCVLAVLAATAVAFVCGSTAAQASRTASPPSLDFGTIKNWPAGGRATTSLTYSISADELNRYAYNRASGGAPDGSTQFSVGGGDCYSVFPPPLLTPASCTIVIQFDYGASARGPSTGTLVIDADTNFDTTADQTIVPLAAYVISNAKKRCKRWKKHNDGYASVARKKCVKKMKK